MTTIYHYTHGVHLRKILADRLLKKEGCNPECNSLPSGHPMSANPALWFTTNPVWEPTCTKTIELGFEQIELDTPELIGQVLGLARIAVPEAIAPMRWDEYAKSIPAPLRSGLKHVAFARGSRPSEWRISMTEVPAELWESVGIFSGGIWHEFQVDEAAEAAAAMFAETAAEQARRAAESQVNEVSA